EKYLRDPVRIAVGSATTPIAKIQQEIIHTSQEEKYSKLVAQLNAREGSIIVFVKTKRGAERLAERLSRAHHSADAIHGDLQQRKRERVIQAFRDKQHRIMVATDIAARGLDIPHIEHVINYDLPQCPEDYIHRIGRTARAGAEGAAVCLISPEDGVKWKAIHRLMNPHEAPDHRVGEQKPRGNGGNSKPFRSRRRYRGSAPRQAA
ncbi:MAG: C-terminal helicase domain-containing protein, partial [Alphaproteobacteria bacterium]|nr:C-terminal helicase domain-containing protein [Alphaproteobacteria bacterium]